MNTETYLRCRGLMRKSAGVVDKLFGWGEAAGKFLAGQGLESVKYALPSMGLMTAWLAYRALSPKAVAESASEYAINANEKESVMQTLRDLEEARLASKFESGKRRVHDQFL